MSSKQQPTRWGYPVQLWAEARESVRRQLVRCATEQGTAAYSELCEGIEAARFRPYSWAFMALLDEACRQEDSRTGAVLATLAVRKDTGRPGEGYFNWAAKTGLLGDRDRESFWTEMAERVWDSYAPSCGGSRGVRDSCHTEAP